MAQPKAPEETSMMDIDPVISQPRSEPETEEEMPPRLTSILPAIFIPLTEDLLEPVQQPKTRIERLERILKELDDNERGVKENLIWMFEREKRRILMEAKQERERMAQMKELFEDPSPQRPYRLDWMEADQMIQSMSAPALPGVDYSARNIQPPDGSTIPEWLSPEEKTTREILILIERGASQLHGYSESHLKGIREEFRRYLEKEKAE